MMSWSNWIYLGLGLGLGLGSSWLFRRAKEGSGENDELILPVKDTDQEQVLELKHTQLAYQLAHQMSQFKAGFLVRTSHELRSPLNSLIGLHQLILSDLCDDPTEEREFVAQAYESALKLINLIDEILGVARIEHGTNQLEIQPLDLAQMLKEVYNLTYLLAANRNFPLQLSLPESEVYISADPHWLRQVLVNLVDTCIAQMDEGSICISAQHLPAEESAHIWLDVQLPVVAWSEPIDLIEADKFGEPINDNAGRSLGLTLLLGQTLLELMKCRLEIFPISTKVAESHFTRIQLTIPLVILETAFLEQEEN